ESDWLLSIKPAKAGYVLRLMPQGWTNGSSSSPLFFRAQVVEAILPFETGHNERMARQIYVQEWEIPVQPWECHPEHFQALGMESFFHALSNFCDMGPHCLGFTL
ncbi:MAG TPA: hypothetical protein VK956_11545, partial [Verrucomicrobium sp.]|nr:hypothetical protein [Verrucomicrobium sp.]